MLILKFLSDIYYFDQENAFWFTPAYSSLIISRFLAQKSIQATRHLPRPGGQFSILKIKTCL